MAKKIMVVDDDQDIVTLLTYNLEKKGFSVTGVLNGERALQIASAVKPDLILLDLLLPGLSGHEVLHLLKRSMQLSRIPVITISAIINREVIKKSYELKASGHICKPFQLDQLVRVMNQTMVNNN